MGSERSIGLVGVVAMLAVGLGTTGSAAAAVVGCGQVITQSTVLSADVGPCPAGGIVVTASGITLDLGGHRVFGTTDTGDGAGILVRGSRGVTVRNGSVTDFDGGVVVEGGTRNTVTRLLVRDNIGASEGHPPAEGTRYGDGIAVEASTDNVITRNAVINNGPFAGIGLYEVPDSDHAFPPGPTTGNRVESNKVEDNTACRRGPFCDNDGIRIEPAVGPGNIITGNQVRRNGLDGISLFADADDNVVRRNLVEANGFLGAVPGDGIRVFASRNLVEQNKSVDNAAGGISVGRRPFAPPGSLPPNRSTGNPRGMNNRILGNATAGNDILDLHDSNPGCDNNLWRANTFQTAQPSCTTG